MSTEKAVRAAITAGPNEMALMFSLFGSRHDPEQSCLFTINIVAPTEGGNNIKINVWITALKHNGEDNDTNWFFEGIIINLKPYCLIKGAYSHKMRVGEATLT